MAKQRRTRAQKEAAVRHQSRTLSLPPQSSAAGTQIAGMSHSAVQHQEELTTQRISDRFVHDLFPYRLTLIYRDLLKTVFITGGMIAVLVGLGAWLK